MCVSFSWVPAAFTLEEAGDVMGAISNSVPGSFLTYFSGLGAP